MIAAIAIRSGVPIRHKERDYDAIAIAARARFRFGRL